MANRPSRPVTHAEVTREETDPIRVPPFLMGPSREGDVTHAGDSRVYHFRGAEMVSRTIDHSLLNM